MAIASFFTELRDLAQHIEGDCHSLKEHILHPDNAAATAENNSTGPSVEKTLADLQAEVEQVDDELTRLVASQQGGSTTQTLVAALHSMVQTHHNALEEVEEELAGFGYVAESPLPTLNDLLLSCKEPAEEEQQDNTFCIDSDTSSDPTLNNNANGDSHAHSAGSGAAEATDDIDFAADAFETVCGTNEPAAHGLTPQQEPVCTEDDDDRLKPGDARSKVHARNSSPTHQLAPEPPLESPSPPMLSRTRIKLSATTMEALRRGDDLSPAGISSTLSPRHMAKYRQGLENDDLSPVPLASSLSRGNQGADANAGKSDDDAHYRAGHVHGLGYEQHDAETKFSGDVDTADNDNYDRSIPQHDIGLDFGMDTDFANTAKHANSEAQNTSQAAGGCMDLSTLSSPGMTRECALRAKYGRPSSHTENSMTQHGDKDEPNTSTDTSTTGKPELSQEQMPPAKAEDPAGHNVSAPTDDDDNNNNNNDNNNDNNDNKTRRLSPENEREVHVEVSQETEEENEQAQQTQSSPTETAATASDSHDDNSFTGNDTLAAHVHEILRDLEPDEYSALPSFVQAQVLLDDLNEVILALRECLKNVGSVEVTLTETQLRDDLCLGTKTKACILALIKTGRMRSQGLPDGTTTYGFMF